MSSYCFMLVAFDGMPAGRQRNTYRMILITNNEGTVGVPITARMIAEGKGALDAIETGIRLIEADPNVRTVGRGGWPNLLGEVELDACLMDGTSLRTGAVGALKGFLHPISVAREVMRRLPHELLVGDGAARFAREIGAETADNLTPGSKRVWQAWFDAEVSVADKRAWPNVKLAELCRHAIDPEVGQDTTVFLAQDASGAICSGTSTSGWGWKYPGRLGDSPIIGAGSYADTRYGAAACTGAGEMTIRCCTARSIVLYMKAGASVAEAVGEAVEDMRSLQGGLINRVTIHAIDTSGHHKVVAVNGAGDNTYWLWRDGDEKPVSERAEPVVITQVATRLAPSTRYGR
jgi:L-asparaginase / beta-aspartyl-peptidase